MRKNRSRILILGVFLLSIFGILLLKNQLASSFNPKPAAPFTALKKEDVTVIKIINDKNIQLISKKDNLWLVKKNNNEFQADQDRVNTLADNILGLKKENIASTNKNKHQDLGISNKKIELTAKNKTYTLFIGNTSGLSNNFVRLDNENEVFVAEGFDSVYSSADFRDLKVHFLGTPNKVTTIEINSNENIVSLNKKGNDWKIGSKTAKKDRVDYFLNDLDTLKANDLMIKGDSGLKLTGLKIKVTEDNKEKVIEFMQQSGDNYLAKSSNSNYYYEIATALVDALRKTEKDFTE